jgi:hypothetical protein
MRTAAARPVSEPRVPKVPAVAGAAQQQHQSLEELMDQAKNFVCRSCSTPVPMGHKFCGRCGAAVPPEILSARISQRRGESLR